jgi:hypothetical protein
VIGGAFVIDDSQGLEGRIALLNASVDHRKVDKMFVDQRAVDLVAVVGKVSDLLVGVGAAIEDITECRETEGSLVASVFAGLPSDEKIELEHGPELSRMKGEVTVLLVVDNGDEVGPLVVGTTMTDPSGDGRLAKSG